jgi:disulfide oxidoreductase YuzD
LYTKLGFKIDKILKPDYRYVDTQNPNERIHKFNLRKRTIHQKYNLPMSMRESEMVKKIGYSKIWDCGLYRYIWKNETV